MKGRCPRPTRRWRKMGEPVSKRPMSTNTSRTGNPRIRPTPDNTRSQQRSIFRSPVGGSMCTTAGRNHAAACHGTTQPGSLKTDRNPCNHVEGGCRHQRKHGIWREPWVALRRAEEPGLSRRIDLETSWTGWVVTVSTHDGGPTIIPPQRPGTGVGRPAVPNHGTSPFRFRRAKSSAIRRKPSSSPRRGFQP